MSKNLKQLVNLIKESAEKEAKVKFEMSPRLDPKAVKELEKLYNVKPDTQKYKRNIIEEAHPTKVVVMPAHDKINGLVENENERQDISLNVLFKKHDDGNVLGRKYAEARKELLLSAIRAANHLDNTNQEDLMKLADDIITKLSIKKQAMGPVAIAAAIIAPIAIIGGAIWWQQNSDMQSLGFERNTIQLKKELQDLIDKDGSLGTSKYKQAFKDQLQAFITHLDSLSNVYQSFKSSIDQLQMPSTASEALKYIEENQSKTDDIKNAYSKFNKEVREISPALEKIKENFKSENYKNEQIEEEGFLSEIGRKLNVNNYLHGGKNSLIADDFQDVLRAIPPFEQSVHEIANLLLKTKSVTAAKKAELEKAKQHDDALLSEDPENKPEEKSKVEQQIAQLDSIPE